MFLGSFSRPKMGSADDSSVVVPEAVDAEKALLAAMSGYCVQDDEDAGQDEKSSQAAELVLLGDAGKLSGAQRKVILQLQEAVQFPCVKLKQVNLSFSGASVYFFTPMRVEDTPLPSSVLKFGTADNVRDEVDKTKTYGKLFGLTTPKVKDVQYLSGADPEEPTSVMQIDLCGGIFGLPEFASAPPVQTFASAIEDALQGKEHKVDVLPIVTEAFERLLYYFTMTDRKVTTMNLVASYKLVRFVGHGILSRAKEGAKRAEKSPALAVGFQMGFTTMTFLALLCQEQVALLLFFNRKGDTKKPPGLLVQDFVSTAMQANNQAAVDTYNDWVKMQKEE